MLNTSRFQNLNNKISINIYFGTVLVQTGPEWAEQFQVSVLLSY